MGSEDTELYTVIGRTMQLEGLKNDGIMKTSHMAGFQQGIALKG